MNRLTYLNFDGKYFLKGCKESTCDNVCFRSYDCETCPIFNAIQCLATYENTNLSAERCTELAADNVYKQKHEEMTNVIQRSRHACDFCQRNNPTPWLNTCYNADFDDSTGRCRNWEFGVVKTALHDR